MDKMVASPSPFVYWAQTLKTISLRVDLKNASKTDVRVVGTEIYFSTEGIGAHGECFYRFNLPLYTKLTDDKETDIRVFENRIDIILTKKEPQWWPRLTATPQKPAWLKINFDLWKSEDGMDSEEEVRDVMTDYPGMYDKLHKEEMGYRKGIQLNTLGTVETIAANWVSGLLIPIICLAGFNPLTAHYWAPIPIVYSILHTYIASRQFPSGVLEGLKVWSIMESASLKEELKKVYLIIYNLFQFVGYMYILSVMCVRYAKLEYASVSDTYANVGSAMKFLQLMQYMEVMHPLFGYTKGGVLVPFMQVSGRAFILFAMIEAEPRMQTKPVVFYLFLVWSTVEIVRYPFYIAQIYKKEIYLLTWLRYSIWIPLYPLGILCESIVILRNIPYFEETQRFTVSMPNEYNFAFHMPSFMRVYLLVLTVPGMFFVMGHMHRLRKTKLRPKVIIKKSI